MLTITIGLLIAVGIEGIVEWQHHRHLAHEAEASLNVEIATNRRQLASIQQDLQTQKRILTQDLKVLTAMRSGTSVPQDSMSINYSLQTFDNVSWRTAQSTGALAYMPYADARRFADIYEGQELLSRAQQAALDDSVRATAVLATHEKPSAAEVGELMSLIGVVQVRLQFVEAVADSLDRTYKKNQAESK